MVICATAKYTRRGARAGGLINMGKVERSLFILINMFSQTSSHIKVLAPLSNLKNDLAFSANFDRKQEIPASLPLSCWTSFKHVRLLILSMASHLSGFTSIPLYVIINPRNFPPPTPKKHFSGLRRRSCFLTLAKTASKSTTGSRPERI